MASLNTTKVDGNTVSASEWNQFASINNFITNSGQTPSTSNLQQMGIASARYSSAGQHFEDTSAGANAYILSPVSPFKSPVSSTAGEGYFTGMRITFKTANANTGASTVNVNSLGTKTLKKSDGSTDVETGDIPSGQYVTFIYNGTNFVKQNQTPATSTSQGIVYLSNPTNLPAITINSGTPNTTLDISAGIINHDDGSGQFVVSAISKIIQSTGSWTAGTGQNGLDAGARGNSTWYQVFIIKKTSDATSDVLFSTSRTSPTIPTGYTLVAWIGAMRTNSSGNIDAKHFAKKTNFGQITQILTGEVATGATTISMNDSIPDNTKGNQFMELQIIPLTSTSRLEIETIGHLVTNGGSGTIVGFLCRDAIANALATSNYTQAASGYEGFLNFKYSEISGTTSATTYKFRAGFGSGSATTTFNGDAGVRQFGGTYASSITIKEYL